MILGNLASLQGQFSLLISQGHQKEYITVALTNTVSDTVHKIVSHLFYSTFPSFFNYFFPNLLVVLLKPLTPFLPYYNKANNTLISSSFQIPFG